MLLALLLISFLPIIIWAYIFSYIDGDRLNKSRFLMGIFSGIVWVMPIIFYEQIFSFLKLSFLFQIFSNFSLFWYWGFVAVFLLIIMTTLFLYPVIIKKSYKKVFSYSFSSFLTFIVFTIFASSILYLFDYLGFLSVFSLWDTSLDFSWIALNSVRLVIFYYLFIAIIEELSKHINFLGYSINIIDSAQKWVMYAIFVTLWFVFIENMLYLYHIYLQSNISWEFFKVYLFRFVFSLMVHVFCSSLLAYRFSKAYLNNKSIFTYNFLKTTFIGIALAVSFHAFFDISLTYWWSFMMIIYFLVGYFYLTGVFYRE